MDVGDLIQHPEGGQYREVYRSESAVVNQHGKKRSALSHIYFRLGQGDVSRFHRVDSDEVWNLYEGEGIVLYVWDDQEKLMSEIVLTAGQRSYCTVVEAGKWQAARPVDGPVLVGCTVAPGFEFEGFTLIKPDSDMAKSILNVSSGFADLVGCVSPES